jgi:Transcriptional regulator, AbiEi antitoxin, Type IV TA system
MFPANGNTMTSENTIFNKAVDVLRERLPPTWTVQVAALQAGAAGSESARVVRIVAPDGGEGELVVQVKRRLDPRRAREYVFEVRTSENRRALLAVAPWMSSATRQVLADNGVNLIDLTGSVRIALAEPGLFIETGGADRDPWPDVSTVTLRGAQAGRIVQALCEARLPIGIRALADKAGTSPGYVSKLVRMLDDQAAVQRTQGGQVVEVDLRRLLERWADDAPLEKRATTTSWLAPRGLSAMQERLRELDVRYAVTGSFAAARRAPVTAPRLVSIYVEDPEAFARAASLRPAEAGANVLLLVPDGDAVFGDTWTDQGLQFAALPMVVADLLSGPGRGPAEAEALLTWMTDNRELWHG